MSKSTQIKHIKGLSKALSGIGLSIDPMPKIVTTDATPPSGILIDIVYQGKENPIWLKFGKSGEINKSICTAQFTTNDRDATHPFIARIFYNITQQNFIIKQSLPASSPAEPQPDTDEILVVTQTVPKVGDPVPDPVTPPALITEYGISLSDVTTLNATANAHGLLPKLPNDEEKVFTGIGTYRTNPFNLIGRYGFVDNTETTISFDPATYIFTLAKVGASFRYFRNGILYTISASKTATLPGTPPAKALYFIYIDSTVGTLTVDTIGWTLQDTKVPVSLILWDNALTPKYHLADERHPTDWDRPLHYYMHQKGTLYQSGGVLSGLSIAPVSPTDTNNTCAISEAVILDENIKITLAALADPDGTGNDYTILYKSAGNWVWESSGMPYRYTAAGYIQYDNAGTMTQGAQSRFYNVYLLFTNYLGSGRFMIVHGKSSFTSLALAQAENQLGFDFAGFPVKECLIMYRLTYETGASYTTKGKCRLAATPQTITTPVTQVNAASVVKVWEDGYTYTIAGEIKVPGTTDIINRFYIPVIAGSNVKITRCIYLILSGTSVTATLKKNNVALTDFTNLSITQTPTTTTASTPVALADLDYLVLEVSAVNGTPKDISFNIMLEKTV